MVLPTQLEDGQSNPSIEDLENLLANEKNLVKQMTWELKKDETNLFSNYKKGRARGKYFKNLKENEDDI